MSRILIVEDEPDIALGLSDDLTLEGHQVEVVGDGETAARRGREPGWDLIVLDVMLPRKDGFDVCRDLRRSGVLTPIILLTAKTQEAEKILGLELGADDYVTKPLSPRELRARIKAVLRRQSPGAAVSMALSPDGRYISAVDYGSDTSTVVLIPIAGGDRRELLRASRPEHLDGFRMIWTPDSRAVIVTKFFSTNSDRKELWLVPVTDGRPRKLDIDVDSWVMPGGGFQLRPNGGQIAFVAEAGGSGPEVWAIENFLFASSATK